MENSFRLHVFNGYVSKIYMAEYSHGILLMDGLAVSDAERIAAYCSQIGRNAADIKLTVVCHMHPDHSGAATLLRQRYGIPIASHPAADRWYSGITGFLQYKMDIMFTQKYAAGRKVQPEPVAGKRKISPDFKLKDGQTLPFFSDWRVIHTPGHTRHDISLYNPESRMMYASDCLVNFKNRPMLPMPVSFPRLLKRTYIKLSLMEIEYLLLGHGEPFIISDSSDFFGSLSDLLDKPMPDVLKQMNRIYVLTPDIWRRIPRSLLRIKKRF